MGVFTTLNEFLGRGTWPPRELEATWDQVELFAAFRTSNGARLRQERSIQWHESYMLSPVPRMISRAKANLLFGEPPELRAGDEADQDNLDYIVEENDLAAELHRGAMISSSEGEVWGRVVVQPDVLDAPIIEFVSRRQVIPHFAGRFVVGATFVTTWVTGHVERYRLFETYERGAVTSRLYRGSARSLGVEADLDSFEETKGIAPQILTGIDWPLCAFIPNTIDANPQRGYSDYAGLEERFFGVNEATTIGQKNMKVAGRKRGLLDAKYLRDGRLPEGDDIFIRDSRQQGDVHQPPLQMIEYDFQADQTIAWLDHLIDSTLIFAGTAPQQVGRQVDGGAVSGTALKLKMAHSLLEASGSGRFWDRGLARLLRGAQILDGRPTTEGGFGRTYTNRDAKPAVQREDGLPRDDLEAASQLSQLVNAEAISLKERIVFLHPEWSEERIEEEVALIRGERPQAPSIETPRPPVTLPS